MWLVYGLSHLYKEHVLSTNNVCSMDSYYHQLLVLQEQSGTWLSNYQEYSSIVQLEHSIDVHYNQQQHLYGHLIVMWQGLVDK